MARVTILTQGSRGDVQPYVALGEGLQRAGYEVRLVTPDDWEGLVTGRGLDYRPFEPQEIAQDEALEEQQIRQWQAFSRPNNSIWRKVFHLARLAHLGQTDQEKTLAGLWNPCRGSEAMIAGYLGFAAPHLCERLRIPYCWAFFQPVVHTCAFPHFMAPWGLQVRGYNRMTYLVAERIYWWLTQRPVNHWRQQELDLPPLGPSPPYRFTDKQGPPVLVGFSPSVVPKPPDWGDRVHVTGYWFLERAPDWRPPNALVDFLRCGPPPVSISLTRFISSGSEEGERYVEMALDALDRSGQRGVILVGDGSGRTETRRSDQFFLLNAVPHDWLFPQMAAVVHHGGAGTTHEGLRAGVPTVTVPAFADQPFWGRRVVQLGVGPAPIPRRKLTVARLAEAIHAATTDPGMRERARALGMRIRAEGGVARAVEIFHRYFSQTERERQRDQQAGDHQDLRRRVP